MTDRTLMLACVDSLKLPADEVAEIKRAIGFKRHDARFMRVAMPFCKKHEQSLDWLFSDIPLDRIEISFCNLVSEMSRDQLKDALAHLKRVAEDRP